MSKLLDHLICVQKIETLEQIMNKHTKATRKKKSLLGTNYNHYI